MLAEAYRASASLWEAEIRRITGAHTTIRKGLRRGMFRGQESVVRGLCVKQTQRELAACVAARSMGHGCSLAWWRLTGHWAQYAVRQLRAPSQNYRRCTSRALGKGHQVT